MGMTIDESIEVIKHEKPEKPTSMYGLMKKNAFNTAIETMRKYQKIEAYMKKLEKNGQYGTLRKLKIVLGEIEDGNDRA